MIRQSRALAALLTASFVGAALAATVPEVVGIAAAVVNDVKFRNAQVSQARAVALRQRIALADQIQTGQRSQLQLMLLDRSTLSVGANARLTIDRFVYSPTTGRSFSAAVAKGAFRFMSGRPNPQGASSIRSPVATIGIRGTIVDGVIGNDAVDIAKGEPAIPRNTKSDTATATMVILRGPGRQTQGHLTVGAITVTAADRTVELDQPMLAAYVPKSGVAPIGPFKISAQTLVKVQDLISPALAQSRSGSSGLGKLLRALPSVGIGIGSSSPDSKSRPAQPGSSPGKP